MTGHRRRTAVLAASALLLAIWLITGCSGPDYPVLDSGHAAFEDDIVWLDNHRVLFAGFEGEKPTTAKRKGLYIWDTRTNQVTWYGKGGGHLCYYEGYVYYGYYNGAQTTKEYPYLDSWKEGPFGKEEYHIHRYKSGGGISRNHALKRSHVDCRLQRHEELRTAYWFPLRGADGYLVEEEPPKGSKQRAVTMYVSPSRGVRQALPVGGLVRRHIQWAPFHAAYFIYPAPVHGTVPCSDGTEGWNGVWLYPDGHIERECIPPGPWVNLGGSDLEATVLGVVVRSLSKDREGLYLPSVYGNERLIKGMAGYPVASPDGCRIAFAHFYDYDILRPDVPGTRTIKMIDLCAGAKAQ
ncbi:MAG: hypothetical protein L0H73_10405 [Nitrococcus sp.]|nr:hypothetical protein [Nitrococcus sp.]